MAGSISMKDKLKIFNAVERGYFKKSETSALINLIGMSCHVGDIQEKLDNINDHFGNGPDNFKIRK